MNREIESKNEVNIDEYENEKNLIVSEILEEVINKINIEYKEKNIDIDNIYKITLGEKIEDNILVKEFLKSKKRKYK